MSESWTSGTFLIADEFWETIEYPSGTPRSEVQRYFDTMSPEEKEIVRSIHRRKNRTPADSTITPTPPPVPPVRRRATVPLVLSPTLAEPATPAEIIDTKNPTVPGTQ